MRSARLEMALETGAVVLPATGRIAVIGPRAGEDLQALPQDRVVVVTAMRPDHDAFAARGYATQAQPDGEFSMALVCVARARDAARAQLAAAAAHLAPGGVIVVDGQKTDGVDTILKDCRALGLTVGEPLAKAHGRLAVVVPGKALQGWTAQDRLVEGGLVTRPGVFSADGPDRGSALLSAALPDKLPARVGDLGAGWGYLARAILARQGVTSLDLVEADAVALDCARRNITDPRAAFHWADATTFKPARPWGAVVMNPPFHAGREADPALGQAFLRAAHGGLQPDGVLWLVANRHLPYDRVLTGLFRDVTEMGGDAAFRVTRAAYPVRAR